MCGDFGEPIKVSRQPPTTRVFKHVTPAVASGRSPNDTSGLHSPRGATADPYAHLSPEQLEAMQQELRDAEIKYGERMRQANLIPEEVEKKQRIDGLYNSFGTRQSLIRKKYGVRLRLRRTRAEIQSERDRIQYRTAAELMSDIGITTGIAHGPSRGRPISSIAHHPRDTRTSTLSSSLPVPEAIVDDDPMTMDVTMHSSKRRFSGSNTDSPNHKRVAYSQMGGLGSAAAAAETNDPTSTPFTRGKGTADEPVALGDTDESDSEDSSEDIPAQLPVSVRQSLQRSSSAALGADASETSRPGSSSPE